MAGVPRPGIGMSKHQLYSIAQLDSPIETDGYVFTKEDDDKRIRAAYQVKLATSDPRDHWQLRSLETEATMCEKWFINNLIILRDHVWVPVGV